VLYEQLRSGASPLFNFCEHAVLKTLDEETVAELVKKPLSQLGIGIEREPEVIRRIVEITSCHPNLTQWICDRLLKNIEWRSLTLSDLDNVINAPDFADHYLSTCWGNADPLERLITLVTETPTFTEQEIFDALARLGIIDDTAVKRALNMLDVGIVVERRGDIFHFRMARFPMMARQHRDVRFEIESLVREVKR
jgi:hypothetical protein